jgi:hypothetical protein
VSYDYWNPFSQKERREIIPNERDCFHSRAQAAVDLESGGRFAKLTPNKVTSAEPISQVPRQPAGSPWASNPVPPGELDQLGYDINEVEAVLPTSSADQSNGSPGDVGTEATEAVTASPPTVASIPNSKSWRRF